MTQRLSPKDMADLDGVLTDAYMAGKVEYGLYIKWKFAFEDTIEQGLFKPNHEVEMKVVEK